ncbi:hypothetical protein [Bdellovibrio svalbardensis]|uniref:Uncharacterized protein n=1 Tax=Bdellovibrio svalbardensis TaxID=2972972 RepID=A0ABT6DJ44_9BACT|nr:hypothetical protein [Bdellovibrio svalbardensis]MDG0816881.1 hypothetical protein [Bdellovibrio svalbardensis]
MAHSMGKHVQAKKKLTKVEFKLFSGSFPKEMSKISRRSLNSAKIKTEKLLQKYRLSRGKSSETKNKILEFRMKSLAKAHERYAKRLDRIDHLNAKPVVKQKKSMTAQPKMKLELKDSPRNSFLNGEKKKMYSKQLKEKRKKEIQGAVNSKRVAGYISARTRKGQVARDRVTSSKGE